jgi:hypothetical protein
MVGQASGNSQNVGPIVALLCIAEVGEEAPIALRAVYGQPLLHHLVKMLEKLGIQRFFVAIDSMPGALLAYFDWAKEQGIDISCLRNPAELATQIEEDVLVLASTTDTIWHAEILKDALAEKQPLIATVEEHSGNHHFERIDLNNRWSGLAILNVRSLAKLTELPEGWDVGSALLRQAQQDGIKHWPIAQKHLQAGRVHKLLPPDDYARRLEQVSESLGALPNNLESRLFAPLSRALRSFIWNTNGSRMTVEWLFPALAGLTAVLAAANIALPAAIAGVVAIFAATLRTDARSLEYQSGKPDPVGSAGWAFGVLALGALLFHDAAVLTDALFLTLATVLLALFTSSYWRKTSVWLFSPLSIALAVSLGLILGSLVGAIKLLILTELASLSFSQLPPRRDGPRPVDRA